MPSKTVTFKPKNLELALHKQAPNPSFKRTRHGKARVAFISFSAKRTSPRRSA